MLFLEFCPWFSFNWAFSLDYLSYFRDINYQLIMAYQYVSGCPKLNSNCNHHRVAVQVRKLGVILDSSLSHTTHTYLVLKFCQSFTLKMACSFLLNSPSSVSILIRVLYIFYSILIHLSVSSYASFKSLLHIGLSEIKI